MTNTTNINTPVSVTAMSFDRDMKIFPRRIEYNGTTYSFIDSGIRAVVNTGGRIAQILTISDGCHDFRLRSDNQGDSWTLLSISQ